MFRDNEEPRNMLPEQLKVPQTLKIHEVPEVTLFSPSNERNKPIATSKPQQIMMMHPPHHSVPDLTIFENKNAPIRRQNFFQQFNMNNNYQENRLRTNSKENKPNLAMPQHPAVPDLTILEDKAPRNKSPVTNGSNGVVFDANYKQYLRDSHDHFIKQIQEKQAPTNTVEHQTQKKSNIFQTGRKTNFYTENPLLKYAPKIITQQTKPVQEKVYDADTSSILIDIDVPKINGRILQPTRSSNSQQAQLSTQEDDEITFKKVADMLKKMQDAVLSPSKVEQQINPEINENTEKSEAQILRTIAFKYLTKDEIQFYNVESELTLLEKKS